MTPISSLPDRSAQVSSSLQGDTHSSVPDLATRCLLGPQGGTGSLMLQAEIQFCFCKDISLGERVLGSITLNREPCFLKIVKNACPI